MLGLSDGDGQNKLDIQQALPLRQLKHCKSSSYDVTPNTHEVYFI